MDEPFSVLATSPTGGKRGSSTLKRLESAAPIVVVTTTVVGVEAVGDTTGEDTAEVVITGKDQVALEGGVAEEKVEEGTEVFHMFVIVHLAPVVDIAWNIDLSTSWEQ